MANELLIPFENFVTRGIQKDDGDRMESSFFSNIYDQTLKLIELIDKTNNKYNDKKRASLKLNFDNTSAQSLNDIQNVIAFTGRRGTGKTSAMLSILDALTSSEKSKIFRRKNYSFFGKEFTSLPYTDASILSDNEDIFEIVLSKMLSYIQQEFEDPYIMRKKQSRYDVNLQSIRDQICNIYNHYSSIKRKSSFNSNSPFNLMERLVDKHNVREEFIRLVEEYTELLADSKDKIKGYLIICIDDIDMAQQKHMAIMQCIHQYFMVPGVIVLLSSNFSVLSATLQTDFFSTISTSKSTDDEHEYHIHLSKEQTYDFLRKIIPPDMRITMPSWRKKDYRELFPIKVNLGKKDNIEKIEACFPNLKGSVLLNRLNFASDKDMTLLPKDLIMLMLANRTKIYLDVKGFKTHFMQPDSLRNLNDLFYLLYNMENIEPLEENNDYHQKREGNRKILLDYLNFKMLQEYNFSSDIRIFLNDVLADPMERRGRKIWDYYYKQISVEKNKSRITSLYGDQFYKEEFSRFKIEEYSFGELFRILYSATRLNIMSRDVVKFILASFSFSLPQFIEKEKVKAKEDLKSSVSEYNLYRRIREAFDYTLIGTWRKDLFNNHEVNITVDSSVIINTIKEKKDDEEGIKKWLEEWYENIIYMLMFCSRSTKNAIKVYEDNGIYKFDIKVDPTSFIVNTIRMDQRMNRMRFEIEKTEGETNKFNVSEILNFIVAYSGMLKNISEDESKNIKEKFYGIFKTALGNSKNNLSKDVPWYFLKHTDLSYNVIKRAISYMIYESDNNLKVKMNRDSESFEIIQKFYGKLVEKLEQEDEIYFIDNNNKYAFAKIFKSNPIFKLFYKTDNDDGKEDIKKILYSESEFSRLGLGFDF